MDERRRQVFEGRVQLPAIGVVRRAREGKHLPFAVIVGGGEVEPVSSYLSNLVVSDVSPLTVRSYEHDLLRWWKILAAVDVVWDRATRAEVELMVGWLRTAVNTQRLRSDLAAPQPGSVNLKTGKPVLVAGYAPATINHALTVVSGFYDFHLQVRTLSERVQGRRAQVDVVRASRFSRPTQSAPWQTRSGRCRNTAAAPAN